MVGANGLRKYPQHNATGQKQHTNPKSRLKLWEADEVQGDIWCYSKEGNPGNRIRRRPLASATVLRGIWSPTLEQRLNTEIEQAAEAGLRTLTEDPAPHLDGTRRRTVAEYLLSLFRRGWQEIAAVPERLRPEIGSLERLIEDAGFKPEEARALLSDIAKLGAHPPGRPLPIKEVSAVIAAMRWTVLECPDPLFLNGDSPVQIVPSAIVSRRCELTIPLSPTRALVGDWGVPQPWTTLRVATPAEVAAVNRRTVQGAKCYVYLTHRLSEQVVISLLDGPAGASVNADGSGRRQVPWRHRVSMQLGAGQILDGLEEEKLALVKRLREVASLHGLLPNEGSQPNRPDPLR